MIMLNLNSTEKKILVWDGNERFIEDHSTEKLIVRSSTPLYSIEEKSAHRSAFENMKTISEETVFKLQDELKMLPNLKFPTVQTTSITQIKNENSRAKLKYCPIEV